MEEARRVEQDATPVPAAQLDVRTPRSSLLPRPALERELDRAFGKRLTVVSAGAGFGKSTLLASWVADVEHAWYTLTEADVALDVLGRGIVGALRAGLPGTVDGLSAGDLVPASRADDVAGADALAALLCERLHERLSHDAVFVLDDVHETDASPAAARFVESLCRQAPETLHLILATRTEPPFPIERLRGRGELLELSGDRLSFGEEELAELVAIELGAPDERLAAALARVTGGWPAATRLALDALQRTHGKDFDSALARLRRPGGELYAYLAQEALGQDEPTRALLQRLSLVDRFSVALCEEALAIHDAASEISGLIRRGFAAARPDGAVTLHALVQDFVACTWPLDPDDARRWHRRIAAWFLARGMVHEALRSYNAADDFEEAARLIAQEGEAMLAAGGARSIIRAADRIPEDLRNPRVEQVVGEAHAAVGEFDRALACFEDAAAGTTRVPPALAWHIVKAHHLRDDLDAAIETYEQADMGAGEPRDEALLLAWTASSEFRRGRTDESRALAARALALAVASADDAALAAAHAAVAMASEAAGELRAADEHQRQALAAAERAGDALQVCRLRNNRGSLLLDQGLYEEAIGELEEAVRVAELAGFSSLLGLALMNRGLCHWCLGRLDEANADYGAAIEVYGRTGSKEISYALIGRGDVCRERGDLVLARASYEQGLALGEESGDRQALVPGLYQLAKVLVDDDPQLAAGLAARAVGYGWPDRAWALNAQGWIALAAGDAARAAATAETAETVARERSDRFGLAEALELRAFSGPVAAAPDHLQEARSIWREIGNPLREATVDLALARLSEGVAAQAEAHRAEQKLSSLGVRVSAAGAAGLLRAVARETEAPVTIETLGGFRIRRAGESVPTGAWRSKKARDLVKILVAHGGRPAPRELLIDLLWPGEDPTKVGNRLSVALSTVRATLDPDKRYPADRFVDAGEGAFALRLDNVVVDVQIFLHDAKAGLALRAQGRREEAIERLLSAEAAYAGDFLEADLYEDWAVPLREEARSAYVDVVRSLAEDAVTSGDREAAVRYFLRLLERDRFDEGAHLGLIDSLAAGGRHGEALRRHRLYCQCMDEIGVEAAPFRASEAV